MNTRVSSIRNLGPAMEQAFARVGINTAEQLHDLGPDEAYRRLIADGVRPHFIAYYAMVMGMQGRPWNDCKGKEKDALRVRFDAIKSTIAHNPISDIENMLDQIGVRKPR